MMDEFHSHGILGILYAEDFGMEAEPPVPKPKVPEPEVLAPAPLTDADIDAACRTAISAAEAEWADSAATRRTAALEALAAGLTEARREADARAEALADGLARTTLAMVAGALPHLCRRHGDAEVSALLHQMLPVLAARTRVVVRVHAGLAALIEDDLARMADEIGDQVELRHVNLGPGDVRLSWEGGSLSRDAAALCEAMTDALAGLGLLLDGTQQPSTPQPHALPLTNAASHETRRLAHV